MRTAHHHRQGKTNINNFYWLIAGAVFFCFMAKKIDIADGLVTLFHVAISFWNLIPYVVASCIYIKRGLFTYCSIRLKFLARDDEQWKLLPYFMSPISRNLCKTISLIYGCYKNNVRMYTGCNILNKVISPFYTQICEVYHCNKKNSFL